MPEERKKINVSISTWNSIKSRQNAERERTGVEPTQGDLMEMAWNWYISQPAKGTPVNSEGLGQTPDRKVLAELLASFHTIHKTFAQATGVLGGAVESLGKEVEVGGKNLSDAGTAEEIEAAKRELESGISGGEKYAGLPGTDDKGNEGDSRADRKKRSLRKPG